MAATIGSVADFVNDYAYNGLGEMVSVGQHGQSGGNSVAEKRVDFTYDDAGQFATITRFADLAGTDLVATGTHDYDLAGQLTSLVYTQGNTTLVGYTWTYDTAGNLTQMVNTIDGTADYTSDSTGQLTDVDYSGGQTDETYSYDANGNRTNTGYTTGDDNRLLTDGTYTYAYDTEGNRTLRYVDADQSGTLTSGDTDITSYTWDYRNRLTTVTHYDDQADYIAGDSDQVVQYTYDYQNRLVRETVDSDGSVGTAAIQQTAYVYDGDQIVLQFEKTGTGDLAAADLSHRYLWGPAIDQLLADEEVADLQTPGDVVWPLTDNLGTVRDLATYDAQNDTTTIANHRVYNSYGKLTSETNAAVDCLFGFTGRLFDEATGSQNNLNRWYDPAVGQWLSQDPMGFAAGDANLYRYVGNSPDNYIDPSGNHALGTTIGNVGRVVGGVSQIAIGVGAVEATGGLSLLLAARGADNAAAGLYGLITGCDTDTFLSQGLQSLGMSRGEAGLVELGVDIFGPLVIGGLASRGGAIGTFLADESGAARIPSRFGRQAAAKVIEQHHQLPRQFASKFKAAGLKIKDFMVPLKRGSHRLKPGGLHTGSQNWNKQWGDFFKANENPSRRAILNQLTKMRKAFGLK